MRKQYPWVRLFVEVEVEVAALLVGHPEGVGHKVGKYALIICSRASRR